ncbi:hypothetical protein B0H11DRAFT_785615 [Mycena galericulata]|nr:hypothetical protein B0H11DRAFT_785615 [Mycena galericulata]
MRPLILTGRRHPQVSFALHREWKTPFSPSRRFISSTPQALPYRARMNTTLPGTPTLERRFLTNGARAPICPPVPAHLSFGIDTVLHEMQRPCPWACLRCRRIEQHAGLARIRTRCPRGWIPISHRVVLYLSRRLRRRARALCRPNSVSRLLINNLVTAKMKLKNGRTSRVDDVRGSCCWGDISRSSASPASSSPPARAVTTYAAAHLHLPTPIVVLVVIQHHSAHLAPSRRSRPLTQG